MTKLALFLRFLTSIPVLALGVLLVLVCFTGAIFMMVRTESARAVPQVALLAKKITPGLVKQVGKQAIDFTVAAVPPPDAPKEIPPEERKMFLAQPAALTFYVPAAAPPAPPPPPPVSPRFVPYGTMIPCKLVNTIDSNADGTPVVAMVLEDMRNLDPDGVSQVVIPAGTLAILGSTQPGRERDRIAADGVWVFVWRTRDEMNGFELPVSGRALSRDLDSITGLYAHGDGRAGLRGEVIEDLESKRLNAAAQAFIQGSLSAAKEYEVSSNALTNQVIRNPLPNLRNTLLGGAEAYVQQYADQIRQRVERDGTYVQVRAGTEFYVFPRETIDLRNARRGTMAQHSSSTPSTK